ncbi:MAG: hypothetical protein J6U09_00895, partial [Lachnospiraceae bacterium]|nr:hypothetical protein [Lachnospiraceae bacterium]
GYPNGRKPDARYSTRDQRYINDTVIPIKEVPNKYCIEWEGQQLQIKECEVRYDYYHDYECITILKADNACHWKWEGEKVFSVLKNVKVNRMYKVDDLVMPVTIKEELKKSLLNSCYGMGGFTTTPKPSFEEMREIIDNIHGKNKETKTMEKKMTVTDSFLNDLNGIAITSAYAKLDHGIGDPYYIYYPEMEITEDIADTLLTVLLMARREYIRKIVFNPKKGTTTIYKNLGIPVTVRCRDGEFNYILGYEMARSKMYIGADDYNWFNKIKNHRKTHIEYTEKPTEPKAKRTSKKGGKK